MFKFEDADGGKYWDKSVILRFVYVCSYPAQNSEENPGWAEQPTGTNVRKQPARSVHRNQRARTRGPQESNQKWQAQAQHKIRSRVHERTLK